MEPGQVMPQWRDVMDRHRPHRTATVGTLKLPDERGRLFAFRVFAASLPPDPVQASNPVRRGDRFTNRRRRAMVAPRSVDTVIARDELETLRLLEAPQIGARRRGGVCWRISVRRRPWSRRVRSPCGH